ncbi:MAG: hypothetical protein A4E45_02062 [Methanosaeta sp. PtaB.Bin039]|nr:MAG: hypothetical protein A4E45_02062 [Methanosaeta sp. PtaB.Bin039]OPY45733.1 MAG: hypothetical protein A4E47_00859 [Methanosaeta sp. PtaU1.Bin028]HOT06581.1 DUF357 domain-containing protein [Methanotrichaceae archaeon]HQF16537.1 DUF357 domain-containing protein [Methanotrichaceae archaeon]HQI91092.1 DUF357 domain-containing protein [Methanotrichaceae archaeon]
MPDISEELLAETEKWRRRAQERAALAKGDPKFMENVLAYIDDSGYFLERGDLVRAFEAVIWAWAWLEIGERQGILTSLD